LKLKTGKVDAATLTETVFSFLGAKRADVILGPALGEDAAIVKVGRRLLALSCDPISGALRRVGWVSAHIACNDVATRGVKPRWLLTVILLPEGSKKKDLKEISKQIGEACSKLRVSVIGGHSETTPGITHPLVVGFAAGIVKGGKFVCTRGAKPGAKIILTKAAGIEGTAILASDFKKTLVRFLGRSLVERAEAFYNQISVVQDALIAFKAGGVQAMHDSTEGGIARGVHELAEASKVGFKIWEENIRIMPETAEICKVFNVNPLALIASGALLIVAENGYVEQILRRLKRKGISASIIGETLDENRRLLVKRNGKTERLISPEQDELWKALEQAKTL
jgi:hydrogenase maturation factor